MSKKLTSGNDALQIYQNPLESIENLILNIRGKQVMLDRDLARLYGVETKRLNEAVKRNLERFPERFMSQLIDDEKNKVVAICDHLKDLHCFLSVRLVCLQKFTLTRFLSSFRWT